MNVFPIISARSEIRAYEILSFVGSASNLWAPDRTGNGNARGRAYAVELLQYIDVMQCPSLLGHVCNAIAEGGEFGAVEIGFFHALARTGVAGFRSQLNASAA